MSFYSKKIKLSLIFIFLASLLAACGNEIVPTVTTSVAIPQATTVAVVVPTLAATAQAATTQPSATVIPANTVAIAPTTQAAATLVPPTATLVRPTATAIPATATSQPAPATVGQLPPIGNNYPAGPAPTAGVPAGGLVDVTLQVPAQFKKGNLAQARTLKLPVGFEISVYSQLGNGLRFGAISPDGRLFVSERGTGRVMWLKDNGTTGEPQMFAQNLNGPHGLAFHAVAGQMYLYIAENDKVSRFAYADGQASGAKKETIVNIPAGGGHTTRSIAFGPDGKMYVSAGSTCNVCEESDARRAAVTQYNADGSGERIFARGLRNEVGILFHPQTGELWGVENSRDNLGSTTDQNNNIPPEEVNIIKDGGDYGWPYCYSNQLYDTNFARKNADYCKQTIPPALPMQAHSAPLGMDFYMPKTQQFPADYKGDLFVGFHGSWNRSPATGFKVVRVQVENGRPVSYEDFATGWLAGQWGRPVAPIVAPDGSLFITDDSTDALYKITYKGQ